MNTTNTTSTTRTENTTSAASTASTASIPTTQTTHFCYCYPLADRFLKVDDETGCKIDFGDPLLNWLLNGASRAILRMLGVKESSTNEILTDSEIEGLVEESAEHGKIESGALFKIPSDGSDEVQIGQDFDLNALVGIHLGVPQMSTDAPTASVA